MEVTLRAARIGDADAVLKFWAQAAENSGRPADTATMLAALIDRDPEALLLAVVAEHIIGTVIAGWDGWRFHLYRLAIHPAHRGQGIAGQLLAAAERRVTHLGAPRIDAMVLDDNASAHGFWRRHGYAPQQEWSRWVKAIEP